MFSCKDNAVNIANIPFNSALSLVLPISYKKKKEKNLKNKPLHRKTEAR